MSTQTERDAKTTALGKQAIALAEQLGRIAGTIEGTAEQWLNRQTLTDQLTRVRDGATQLLDSLSNGAGRGRRTGKAKAVPAGKGGRARGAKGTADPARAPGKSHRKPAPSMSGVKKSDERIPKARAADAVRQRRKSHA
jgi:hypothetical protein